MNPTNDRTVQRQQSNIIKSQFQQQQQQQQQLLANQLKEVAKKISRKNIKFSNNLNSRDVSVNSQRKNRGQSIKKHSSFQRGFAGAGHNMINKASSKLLRAVDSSSSKVRTNNSKLGGRKYSLNNVSSSAPSNENQASNAVESKIKQDESKILIEGQGVTSRTYSSSNLQKFKTQKPLANHLKCNNNLRSPTAPEKSKTHRSKSVRLNQNQQNVQNLLDMITSSYNAVVTTRQDGKARPSSTILKQDEMTDEEDERLQYKKRRVNNSMRLENERYQQESQFSKKKNIEKVPPMSLQLKSSSATPKIRSIDYEANKNSIQSLFNNSPINGFIANKLFSVNKNYRPPTKIQPKKVGIFPSSQLTHLNIISNAAPIFSDLKIVNGNNIPSPNFKKLKGTLPNNGIFRQSSPMTKHQKIEGDKKILPIQFPPRQKVTSSKDSAFISTLTRLANSGLGNSIGKISPGKIDNSITIRFNSNLKTLQTKELQQLYIHNNNSNSSNNAVILKSNSNNRGSQCSATTSSSTTAQLDSKTHSTSRSNNIPDVKGIMLPQLR